MTADLHVHTYASDGSHSPEEVLNIAKERGVSLISVTDHDTDYFCSEVKSLSVKKGISTVSGIEISAYIGDVKIHTLGYNFDPQNAAFRRFVEQMKEDSFRRTQVIVDRLTSFGVKMTLDEAAAMRKIPVTPVHAMHIARCGANKGYAPTPYEFYKIYMFPGKVGCFNGFRPTPEQAVEIITEAGGIAVMAHPGRVWMQKDELNGLIARMTACGLKGIEAVYSSHTKAETAYYKELAKKLNIFVTGGSDFHSKDESRMIGQPAFEPHSALLHALGI